jgi:hypothetical protein
VPGTCFSAPLSSSAGHQIGPLQGSCASCDKDCEQAHRKQRLLLEQSSLSSGLLPGRLGQLRGWKTAGARPVPLHCWSGADCVHGVGLQEWQELPAAVGEASESGGAQRPPDRGGAAEGDRAAGGARQQVEPHRPVPARPLRQHHQELLELTSEAPHQTGEHLEAGLVD